MSAGALVQGKEDVDTDVFFARPKGTAVATEEKTRETWGLTEGKYGRVSTTQTGLIAPLESSFGLTAVLYPRLKSETRPILTPLVDGNGVKVETDAGTDYVFLGANPLTFHDGTITFEGTAGAVLMRGERTLLWLGQPSSIAAHGETLRKEPDSAAPYVK